MLFYAYHCTICTELNLSFENQPDWKNAKVMKNIKAQFLDVVTLWSTIEGFASLRYIKGSSFIQTLCEKLLGKDEPIIGEWIDLLDAHLATTYDITSGATQIEVPIKYNNGTTKYHQYWINQTPLYKSTACQKIGFRKTSGQEQTVFFYVPQNDAIHATLVQHIEEIQKTLPHVKIQFL